MIAVRLLIRLDCVETPDSSGCIIILVPNGEQQVKTTCLIRRHIPLETDAQRVVGSLAVWMVVSAIILSALGVFTAENYILSSYIGLLSIMEVYAPVESRPSWWVSLRWAAVVGFFVFVVVMYLQIAPLVQI